MKSKTSKRVFGGWKPLSDDQTINATKPKTYHIPKIARAALGARAKIWFLPEFIHQHVPSIVTSHSSQSNDQHLDDERRLFENTLVSVPNCYSSILISKCKDMGCQQRESLSSLVDGVVWSLVQRRSRRLFRRQCQQQASSESRNILSQGYVAASEELQQRHAVRPCPNMRPGVLCIHLNDNVSYCQTSRYFQFLHAMLGDDCLRMLLLQTTLLIPVYSDDNQHLWRGNYLQLCGPPLPIAKGSCLPPKQQQPSTTNMLMSQTRKTRKRRFVKHQSNPSELPKQRRLDASEIVPRKALFYSDSFVPKVGLPSRHVLNVSPNSQQLLASMLDELVRETPNASRTTASSIKKAAPIQSKRWWPRLKSSGLPICGEIMHRHATCDYARLLERHCALHPLCCTNRVQSEDCNVELSNQDGHSPSLSLDQVAMAHTPADHVLSFLASVLRRVFPLSFWGSEHNFQSTLHVIKLLVQLRRQERMSNQRLLQGFRVMDVLWLVQLGKEKNVLDNRQKQKLSRSQNIALTKRVICVLRWVIAQFVIPLLRSTFYATETEFSGRNVLYYRKPVWSLFRSLSMDKLLRKQYKELDWNDALERLLQQHLSFSRLRLLPKATGVRPLATLNVPFVTSSAFAQQTSLKDQDDVPFDEPVTKKQRVNRENIKRFGTKRKVLVTEVVQTAPHPKRQKHARRDNRIRLVLRGEQSSPNRNHATNEILKETFDVMRYEVGRNPELFGSGMFGLNELYPRYSKFMRNVQEWRQRQDNAQLYFASVDIHKCYDNIQQQHLLALVRQNISDQDYLIQHYSLVFPFESTGRVFKRQKKKVGPPETFKQFHRTAKEMTASHRNCIFVDGTRCSLTKRDSTIKLLEEHLQSHVVVAKGRYGNRFLLQGNGIPQGSVLSSLLCNIYYGDVEKEILGQDFSEENGSTLPLFLLVRMVDDFLLITTDRKMAVQFVEKMYAGSPCRGALINREKTTLSFDMEFRETDGKIVNLTDGRLQGVQGHLQFPWCGLLFDSHTGEIRVDYSRFAGGKALGALTVDRTGEHGRRLALYMKTFVRPRCQSILFDPSINSGNVVAINFYQMFLLCAMKAVEYIQSSEMNPSSNQEFIIRSIDDAVCYARGLINCRLRLDSASSTLTTTDLNMTQKSAFFLGRQAFSVVFQRSGSNFHPLSRRLAIMRREWLKHTQLRRATATAMSEIKLSGML